MTKEIDNKVSNSVLKVFDLEDYYTEGIRVQLDVSQFLTEGFLLKEKEFRAILDSYNWSEFKDQFVAIYCKTDAILPAWAMVLVTAKLAPIAKKVVLGTLKDLETSLYQEKLQSIDFTIYKDKPVILKGCSKKPVPESAYIIAIQYLQKEAKSVMYGEACSAVPIFKQKKGN